MVPRFESFLVQTHQLAPPFYMCSDAGPALLLCAKFCLHGNESVACVPLETTSQKKKQRFMRKLYQNNAIFPPSCNQLMGLV